MKNKKDHDIKEKFRITDRLMQIDENRKRESISLLQNKIKEKQINMAHHGRKILLQQVRYMDKLIMITQIVLYVIVVIIAIMMRQKGVLEEEIILFSILISGLFGIISIAQISRIFSSGIAELSESCYFNVKQIVAFQLLISGVMNLTMLFFVILFVGLFWKIALIQIGLYILVPFVIAQCCCLKALLLEIGRKNSYLLIIVGIFITILYIVIASIPRVYQLTALSIWGVSFVVGILLLGMQVRALFEGIERGDILCMN